MSQQINLLVREAGKVRFSTVPALVLLLVLLFAALAVAGLKYREVWRLQAERVERKQALDARAAELERLRQQVRLAEGAATSTARTQAAEALKAYLQNSPPGRSEGPSATLTALAKTDPGRAWLTQVVIGSAGVRLEGRALEPAAVLDYAATLETRAAGAGLVFRTVELNSVAPGQGVSFRLY